MRSLVTLAVVVCLLGCDPISPPYDPNGDLEAGTLVAGGDAGLGAPTEPRVLLDRTFESASLGAWSDSLAEIEWNPSGCTWTIETPGASGSTRGLRAACPAGYIWGTAATLAFDGMSTSLRVEADTSFSGQLGGEWAFQHSIGLRALHLGPLAQDGGEYWPETHSVDLLRVGVLRTASNPAGYAWCVESTSVKSDPPDGDYADGTSLDITDAPALPDRWYHVRLEVDLQRFTYGLLIDGVEVKVGSFDRPPCAFVVDRLVLAAAWPCSLFDEPISGRFDQLRVVSPASPLPEP